MVIGCKLEHNRREEAAPVTVPAQVISPPVDNIHSTVATNVAAVWDDFIPASL